MKDGVLYINADLFWKGNKQYVEVSNNQISNLPNGWQLNHDGAGAEIVNEYLVPILQIVYTGEHSAMVRGIFEKSNDCFLVTDEGLFHFPCAPGMVISNCPPLTRIFKYPAYRFPGQREQ
jgi:hypothetical protein